MPFYKQRAAGEPPLKNQLILAVGWRAFVNAPASLRERIITMGADGDAAANTLADGDEVEILGWRPRMTDGTRYQIRRLSDGREWWIGVSFLRKARVRAA